MASRDSPTDGAQQGTWIHVSLDPFTGFRWEFVLCGKNGRVAWFHARWWREGLALARERWGNLPAVPRYTGVRPPEGPAVVRAEMPTGVSYPLRSLMWKGMTPPEFDWGRPGAGALECGVCLLFDGLGTEQVERGEVRRFVHEVVERLPVEGWSLGADRVWDWYGEPCLEVLQGHRSA